MLSYELVHEVDFLILYVPKFRSTSDACFMKATLIYSNNRKLLACSWPTVYPNTANAQLRQCPFFLSTFCVKKQSKPLGI